MQLSQLRPHSDSTMNSQPTSWTINGRAEKCMESVSPKPVVTYAAMNLRHMPYGATSANSTPTTRKNPKMTLSVTRQHELP